ncbi:hypothetical protein PENTCL1PPCAC_19624, partial [Pristionchus entomophagus]
DFNLISACNPSNKVIVCDPQMVYPTLSDSIFALLLLCFSCLCSKNQRSFLFFQYFLQKHNGKILFGESAYRGLSFGHRESARL